MFSFTNVTRHLGTPTNYKFGWRSFNCPSHPKVFKNGLRTNIRYTLGFPSRHVSEPSAKAFSHFSDRYYSWDPYQGYTGISSNQSAITHGTFFWHASREGCISKGTSVHGGLRTKLFVSLLDWFDWPNGQQHQYLQ
jgi:hypothetical protein